MARPKATEDSPNSGLGVEEFDYNNLSGENFKKYKEIESKLLFGKKYDFEVWKATSKIKFRVNEDTGEKEQFVDGLILNAGKPEMITRISALQAMEINKQVTHMNDNISRQTSKYLLLKKPVKEASEVAQ